MPAGLTSELGLLAARNFFKRNERVSLEKQVKSIQKKKASQKVTSDYDERQWPPNLSDRQPRPRQWLQSGPFQSLDGLSWTLSSFLTSFHGFVPPENQAGMVP